MPTELNPEIAAFYEPVTGTVSYVVYDTTGGHAAIIDPVLDYDPKSGRTSTESAARLLSFIGKQGLKIDWILETHAHADHLSAAHYLQQAVGGKIAIGKQIAKVQRVFKHLFNLEDDFAADGSQFDHRFEDNDVFAIGALRATALFVPGHTPADMAFRIGDAVFVGDTIFMPDVGTARCDFPGGDALQLHHSIQRLLALPPATRLFMCHDYPPPERAPAWETTVAQQRQSNIHVHDGIDATAFSRMRTQRDAGLPMPVLILPAIQVNIRAGALPPPEDNGIRYLKIPLNSL